jgi:hypothetical protein
MTDTRKAAWQVAADGDAVISSVQALDFSSYEIPSLIFIRLESTKRRDCARVYIPTAFLAGQLASRVLIESELQKLFSQLTIYPDNWTRSRWLYKNIVYAQFRENLRSWTMQKTNSSSIQHGGLFLDQSLETGSSRGRFYFLRQLFITLKRVLQHK